MREQMGEDIGRLADKSGVTPEGALGALKSNYDGYHFTWLLARYIQSVQPVERLDRQ